MFKIERQAYIENELKKNKSVLISDLCQALDCSMETIRRDLKELEAAGKAQRIYGGAFLPEENDLGVPAKLRETFFFRWKSGKWQSMLSALFQKEMSSCWMPALPA